MPLDALHKFLLGALLNSPAYRHYDGQAFSHQLGFEIDSGQWVQIADEKKAIHGWLSYYLVNDETLEVIKSHPFSWHNYLKGHADQHFCEGENLFFANCWVAPWAPKSLYKNLAKLVNARESHVKRLASFLYSNSSGKHRYHERRPFVSVT